MLRVWERMVAVLSVEQLSSAMYAPRARDRRMPTMKQATVTKADKRQVVPCGQQQRMAGVDGLIP